MFYEKEYKGRTYQIGKLSAMEQFHVSRKLAPALAAAGGVLLAALKGNTENFTLGLDAMAEVAGPVAEVISKMSNEEVEFVIRTCMKVVRVKQEDRWAAMVTGGGDFMFQDVDMMTMLALTSEVIRWNLGSFFQTPPSAGAS